MQSEWDPKNFIWILLTKACNHKTKMQQRLSALKNN